MKMAPKAHLLVVWTDPYDTEIESVHTGTGSEERARRRGEQLKTKQGNPSWKFSVDPTGTLRTETL
jgi:hypothetical protein